MTSRKYALSLIAVATIMFVCTIATNLIVDPEGVFGSPFFTGHLNPNMRYVRYVSYKKQAANVQGLIFGSSRAYAIDPELVRQYLPQEGRYLNVSMPFGLLTDHTPLLEYIVRDKSARGETLENVLLLLDIDFFGDPPWTNRNIDAFLPPELGGDFAGRFWWRYLTAVQMRSWRDTINVSRFRAKFGLPQEVGVLGGVAPRRASMFAIPSPVNTALRLANDASDKAATSAPPGFAGFEPVVRGARNAEDRRAFNAVRPDLERQVALFARFAQLCRDHGVRLTVLTSPIPRYVLEGFSQADLQRVLDRLDRFAPIWDFTTQGEIADLTNLWIDITHFRSIVVEMMLDRAIANRSGTTPRFGRLVPQAAP